MTPDKAEKATTEVVATLKRVFGKDIHAESGIALLVTVAAALISKEPPSKHKDLFKFFDFVVAEAKSSVEQVVARGTP